MATENSPPIPVEAVRRENVRLRERIVELEHRLQCLSEDPSAPPRLAEEQSEREALLLEAERVARVGSWVWDLGRSVVTWSDELYRILGYERGLVTASSEGFFARVHPDDLPRVQEVVNRGLARGVAEQVDFRIVRTDDVIRHVVMNGALLFGAGGAPRRAVGTIQDITESRARAEALMRSATLLAEAQRIGKMGSFELDLTTRRFVWSDELYRIMDIDPTLEPSVELFLERLHEDDREDIKGHLEDAVLGILSGSQARCVRRDGETRHLDLHTKVVEDGAGRPLAVRGTISDVSERVEMETRLHQNHTRDALGHLAGGIAHDFNNLLTVIFGNLELLMLEDEREELREIHHAVTLAATLTRRLLTFGRQSTVPSMQSTLPEEEFDDAIRLIRQVLSPTIELVVSRAQDLGAVLTESGTIPQLLLNLALNARDAMPDGGRLEVSMARETLSMTSARRIEMEPGPYLQLVVQDNGEGMDDKVRSRAFEPFFSTKPPGYGSGLGLSMVLGTMALCRGGVELHSQPGEGTRVTLLFPLIEPPDHVSLQARKASTPRRILLVDADLPVGRTIAATLRGAGHDVRFMQDPREALRSWDSAPTEALIVDLSSSQMSGAELARRLTERTPSLRTIFLTANVPRSDMVETTPMRSTLLFKPFPGHALLGAIDALFDPPED